MKITKGDANKEEEEIRRERENENEWNPCLSGVMPAVALLPVQHWPQPLRRLQRQRGRTNAECIPVSVNRHGLVPMSSVPAPWSGAGLAGPSPTWSGPGPTTPARSLGIVHVSLDPAHRVCLDPLQLHVDEACVERPQLRRALHELVPN